jgi:hypothetical protein
VKIAAAIALACFSISCLAEAVAPKMADVFKDVTYSQPKCYGREYTRAELKAHPEQTVEQIKAKLLKYSADTSINSNGLQIEVRLAGENGVNYHAEFSCMTNQGQTFCAIDCDGGSVTVAEFDAQHMTLKSNGFTIKGGCDGEGTAKTKFLQALKDGDDLFKLDVLPTSYCSDVSPVIESQTFYP